MTIQILFYQPTSLLMGGGLLRVPPTRRYEYGMHMLVWLPPKQPDSQLRAGEAIPTFTADGKHIVGRANAWDVETGEIVPVPKSFQRTSPAVEGLDSPVQYSRDGTRIVLGLGDGSIRIWDATTGDLMTSLVGHTGPISSVAVSPDGKRIISSEYRSKGLDYR